MRTPRERCRDVRAALVRLGVDFLERDVSMRESHADELERRLAGEVRSAAAGGDAIVPALFVDDARVAIGVELEEMSRLGLLGKALREKGEVRTAAARDGSCPSCGGEKLVVCAHCDGSMRILMRDKARGVDVERRCPWCNEVGMQECADCPQ